MFVLLAGLDMLTVILSLMLGSLFAFAMKFIE